MKLSTKTIKLSTGKLIALLDMDTAKKINVFPGNRVSIKSGRKEVAAVVDIVDGLVKKNEVGLCTELVKRLGLKNGNNIDVKLLPHREADKYILKKFNGVELNEKEIRVIIDDIMQNNMTEAEIAYFISGQKCAGMSLNEIYFLTKAMVETGNAIKFSDKIISDKHCIGGVAGNRTTPIIVSICAAAGLILPKTSSRAITSAAGTADVIETIANIEIETKKLKGILKKAGAFLIWNSDKGLSPSDDHIIKIERILNLDIESQLIASVLSKKISVGANNLIIDIPYGTGAKIEDLKRAKKLKSFFVDVGKKFGINTLVVFTKGSSPIGNGIGPNLEMIDVIKVLKNEKDSPRDLKKKGILLASELMKLNGIKNAKSKARKILESGEAFNKFREIINLQNGKNNFDKKVGELRFGKYKKDIVGWSRCRIKRIDNKKINTLCRILGSPEAKGSGVYLHRKRGNVKKGDLILTLYSDSLEKLKEGMDYFWQERAIRF